MAKSKEIDVRPVKLYVYKALADKLGKVIEAIKAEYLNGLDPKKKTLPKDVKDENGLEIKFTHNAGKSSFDREKAIIQLKLLLGKKYAGYFTGFRIEKKDGVEVPEELLEMMKKYFTITKVDEVDEDKIKRLPLGLTQEQIKEACYKKGNPFFVMNTPTKISDKELVEIYKKTKLDDVMKTLLLQ